MFFAPHCVDNEFFASGCSALKSERENLRRQWNIPKDFVVFLFAGKLIPKKRPFDFLKALNLARKGSSKIYGLIVGDGPLRSELETFAQKNNLPVAFTRFLNQKEMPKAYAVTDVLVLHGRETWGLVVNEAMACGIPSIVSDEVGCGPDLVIPDQTGKVFYCGNIKQLSDMMVKFSSMPEMIQNMKIKIRNIITTYSIDNAVEGIIKALRGVVGKK